MWTAKYSGSCLLVYCRSSRQHESVTSHDILMLFFSFCIYTLGSVLFLFQKYVFTLDLHIFFASLFLMHFHVAAFSRGFVDKYFLLKALLVLGWFHLTLTELAEGRKAQQFPWHLMKCQYVRLLSFFI